MENLPPAPQPLPPETTSKAPSLVRAFLIGIALMLFGALLGILAFRFLPTTPTLPISVPPTVSPTAEITPELTPTEIIAPIPTATPSALLNLKWNVMTVKSPVSSFYSYRISYPTTWSIKEYKNIPSTATTAGRYSLVLTKGSNTLSLSSDIPTYTCDIVPVHTITKDISVWQIQGPTSDSGYQLCEEGNGAEPSTRMGAVTLTGPSIDDETLSEFNYILEKIVILPSSAYTCPKTEWVDCEPTPDGVKPQCSTDYLKWAQTNCPGFQGAAL